MFGEKKKDKLFEKEVTLKCSMCGKSFTQKVTAKNAADLAGAVASLKKKDARCDDCRPDKMGSGGSW